MTVSSLKTHDAHVWGVVVHLCAKIRGQFPEVTFDVCAHPTQRGAMIDAHVATDDDFAVLDLDFCSGLMSLYPFFGGLNTVAYLQEPTCYGFWRLSDGSAG